MSAGRIGRRVTFVTLYVASSCATAMVLVLAGCAADGDRPGFVVLPGMVTSVPFDAYDPNPLQGSGQTLRLPPEGTIPMNFAPFPYGSGPEEARRAGQSLANPLASSAENLARGKAVFESKCVVCHGANGEGDGPIIGRFPNPPSLLAPHARGLADGQLFHIVTMGQGIMPSHAVQVLPDDRWRAILHVRALQNAAASGKGGR